ncbi:MAG: phenylalanine--tRNA ligase beta subunit-related protein [Planctomycetota bacterium]
MSDELLDVCEHPKLDARYFVTEFPRPLGDMDASPLASLLSLSASTPVESDDTTRKAVRDMLRETGFKPTGRSKPASEYLLKAESSGRLSSINLAVDACNVCSLHSGLPISVVDLDLTQGPFSIWVAEVGSSYVFNQSGQEIDIGGLLCLFDASGPCANAIKDSQRTKTSETTTRTLSIIWGIQGDSERTLATESWYRELLKQHVASI